MAIEYVGASSASTTTNGIDLPYPSGLQDGDTLVVVSRSWNAAADPSYPIQSYLNDWTQRLVNTSRGGGTNLYVYTKAWKPAQESAHPYASLAFVGNGNHQATVLAFRGVDPVNPINATAQAYDTTGTSHITPAATTTVGNTMVVRAIATGFAGATGSCSWPVTVDERSDTRSTAGYSYLSTATALNPPTGPSGTAMATYTTSSYAMMATIALAPAMQRRMMLGSTAVPLMLGSTEVEVKGP